MSILAILFRFFDFYLLPYTFNIFGFALCRLWVYQENECTLWNHQIKHPMFCYFFLLTFCFIYICILIMSIFELWIESLNRNNTNIDKASHEPPLTSTHKKDHNKWRWKSRSLLWTGTNLWRVKTGQWETNPPPLHNWVSNGNMDTSKRKNMTHSLFHLKRQYRHGQ